MSPTPDSLQQILDDLYQADPNLRQHEAQLIPLIRNLLERRPDIKPDPSFYAALRTEVLTAHAKTYSQKKTSHSFLPLMPSLSLKPLALPVVGVLAFAALMVAVLPKLDDHPAATPPSSQVAVETGSILKLSDRAFGSFEMTQQAGGRGAASLSTTNPVPGMGGDAIGKMMIAPADMTNIRYVYTGDLPSWNETVEVYKRLKGEAQNTALTQTLSQNSNAFLSLAGLNNLQLQSFTLNQNQPFGLAVTVDYAESVANLNQNYAQWPHPETTCRDEACFQSLRLKPSDMLSDEDVIRIADEFLKENGISTEKYGAPQVNTEWRRQYEMATDKNNVYVPESLTVTYPVTLEGKTAYDEGGSVHGLAVSVSARHRRVDGVWNLTTNSFQSSAYAAETDLSKIRAVMERGGIYGFLSVEASKTVEVELEAPEIVLQKTWVSREPGQPMDELLVPALRFKVKETIADGIYTPNSILVPLVKEILDRQTAVPGDVRIMM